MKKRQPLYINDRFYNKKNEPLVELKKVIYNYFLSFLDCHYGQMGRDNHSHIPTSVFAPLYQEALKKKEGDDILIIPLGHASILIYFENKSFLFDPLVDSCSFFFQRYTESIPIHFLSHIDFVIYTHNHPDHYDKKTLQTILHLFPETTIIGPDKFISFFKEEGINHEKIFELQWWESLHLTPSLKILCTPAIHWSQSNFSNQNKTLWASWTLFLGKTVLFFCGDSAYGDHFKEIYNEVKKIDIAFLPIAPNEPKEIQKVSHLNLEQSYKIFQLFQKPIFIPFHWGVFAYGNEDIKEPIEKLIHLFAKHGELDKLQGTTINLPYLYKK
jgi:L-ascorbate metabolism protein UlaG (beta-lactamase superfamily)